MSYLALYRKYRPSRFEDVSGQDTTVRILRNQIVTGRIGHAYLFSGIRGTGKTTLAKIFARAVSCENPQDGSPCGVCPTCVELGRAGAMDIVEIDAASNRGVDEIRDLREKVKYPPTTGSFKVYIIDEVHMLTKEAFNALLKTLEEPPEHAIFLLATTEPAKLPATIQSRCQCFEIHPIGEPVVERRMREISGLEGLVFDDEAYRVMAQRAHHSMRDGLSLLDQASDLELPGTMITGTEVRELLGTAREDSLRQIADAHSRRDPGALIEALGRLREAGVSENLLLEDLIRHYRDLILIRAGGGGDAENTAQAEEFELSELYRAVNVLIDAHAKLRFNSLSDVITDTALLRLCAGPEEPRRAAAPAGQTAATGYAAPDRQAAPVRQTAPDRQSAAADRTAETVRPAAEPAARSEAEQAPAGYPETAQRVRAEAESPAAAAPAERPSRTQKQSAAPRQASSGQKVKSAEIRNTALNRLHGKMSEEVLKSAELVRSGGAFYLLLSETEWDLESRRVSYAVREIEKTLVEITGRKEGLKAVGRAAFEQKMRQSQSKVHVEVQNKEQKTERTGQPQINTSASPAQAAPVQKQEPSVGSADTPEQAPAPSGAPPDMERLFREIVPGDYPYIKK